jgi:flagellar basal body-associated protein FliL
MEVGTISPDGYYQWDGSKWIPVELAKVSDDGYWMWNGTEWIPNPNRPKKETFEESNQPSRAHIEAPQVHTNAGIPTQYISTHQQPQVVQLQPTKKKSGAGLWIALAVVIIIIPIFLIASGVVMAGVLYVWSSEITEDPEQSLAGTWYNEEDTLTLYSNGTVLESSGTIVRWSSQGENFTTTLVLDEDEVDLVWRYRVELDSDDDRVLFIAVYEFIDGVQTNEVSEGTCITYFDSVESTEEDYNESKEAFIPDWCTFEESS